MARYQIPIVVVIEANSYEEAFDIAKSEVRARYYGNDTPTQTMYVTDQFFPALEHDEFGQRVIYLHPENDPEYKTIKNQEEKSCGHENSYVNDRCILVCLKCGEDLGR